MSKPLSIEQTKFVRELEFVSVSLAQWAQHRMVNDDWTLDACKAHLRHAMKVVELHDVK